MCYKNMMLFVQHLPTLVTFSVATLMKGNIATSFQNPLFKLYSSQFSNFDRNALNNKPDIKNWLNILFYYFMVSTSITLSFFTNEIYFFNNTYTWQLFAQYIYTIMQYGIGWNIVNIANQLFFFYQWLASEFHFLFHL